MKNWIIKLLGGVSFYDHAIALRKIDMLEYNLKQARKNDSPRDPETGRFVKRKK